jgi:hypothetical protein
MKETVEYKSAQTIEVKVDPHNRDQYLKNLMELEGLEDTHEDPKAAFWPIGPSCVKTYSKNSQFRSVTVLFPVKSAPQRSNSPIIA